MVKKIGTMSKKIIIIMIIFQIIFIPISNAAFWGNIIKDGNDFITEGESGGTDDEIDNSELESTIKDIYNALLTLGVVLSVIIGAILGIKYMLGSVEEQAKTKELLFPYVTGCIVTFGAFGIWKILINVLSHV